MVKCFECGSTSDLKVIDQTGNMLNGESVCPTCRTCPSCKLDITTTPEGWDHICN